MDKEKIKYILTKKGLTLADLDRRNNLKYGTCRYALHMPNAKGEVAIAKELGISLNRLFPTRYDASGKRYSPQPSDNYNYKRRGVASNA